MNDAITALFNLPHILFSQVGVSAPLNNSLISMVLSSQTNYNNKSHGFLSEILTEAPVFNFKATSFFGIFTFGI